MFASTVWLHLSPKRDLSLQINVTFFCLITLVLWWNISSLMGVVSSRMIIPTWGLNERLDEDEVMGICGLQSDWISIHFNTYGKSCAYIFLTASLRSEGITLERAGFFSRVVFQGVIKLLCWLTTLVNTLLLVFFLFICLCIALVKAFTQPIMTQYKAFKTFLLLSQMCGIRQ